MAHLVTKDNIHLYVQQIRQMYQHRYQVFVENLRWNLPLAKNGLEIDQYDTEDAVYILSLDHNMDVVGSMRLLPTIQDHLMSDLFSHLLNVPEPIGESIWESSRTCLKPSVEIRAEKNIVLNDVFIGMAEAAVMLGIEKVTFVANMQIYSTLLAFGGQVEPLGFPQFDAEGEEIIASSVSINRDVLNNVWENHNIKSPTLIHTDPQEQAVA
ncbi:MAG: hypothetical protein COB49_11105 [Alphaproteobacteria bacterium]|nr:MAG: hypothetical protein COB49_11105 [Alphaproteobacteria bacterium]